MPTHTHTQNAHGHTQDAHNHTASTDSQGGHVHNSENYPLEAAPGTFAAGSNARTRVIGGGIATTTAGAHTHSPTIGNSTPTIGNATAVNQNAGSGDAHANMQPFVVVNKMIRIA
jgi:microcystin-dependent protein